MNDMTIHSGNAVTMTSLELVEKKVSLLFSDPEKDHEWHRSAFEFIENNDLLHGLTGLRKALITAIGALFSDHLEKTSTSKMIVNSLYIMESEAMGAVKVGRTWGDVEKRANQLRTACPDIRVSFVYVDKWAVEPAVHRRLRDFCIGGEWFSLSANEVDFVIQEEIKRISK